MACPSIRSEVTFDIFEDMKTPAKPASSASASAGSLGSDASRVQSNSGSSVGDSSAMVRARRPSSRICWPRWRSGSALQLELRRSIPAQEALDFDGN